MSSTILRIPRPDHPEDEPGFVLLLVQPAGKRPLDLKLIGTENENVFEVSVKHKDTSTFRAEKFTGTQDLFDDILSAILLGKVITDDDETRGIEALAKITHRKPIGEKKNKPFLNITIQRRIEGITQKYGEIELPKVKNDDLSLFDWCGIAAEARDSGRQELQNLKLQLRSKEEETAKLTEALAELVQRKNAHENELIEKFALLLNEKKLKVRDQQRLLATATVDPEKLAAIEASREHHSPGPSRSRKRKATVKDKEAEATDDGLEKMEVDDADSGGEEEQQTPDSSDAGDATEDEDDDIPPVTKGKTDVALPFEEDDEPALPPRRELPFATKKKAPVKVVEEKAGSETESDDEL